MPKPIRAVVTGRDERGSSVVLSDGPLSATFDPSQPSVAFHLVWGTADGTSHLADSEPAQTPFFPGPGGTRFIVSRFSPNSATGFSGPSSSPAAADPRLAGIAEQHEDDGQSGFHTTATIDYFVVLEGTMTLEMDDGVEVELGKGTVMVQRGTRHQWTNKSDREAVMAVVMVGSQ